MAIDKKLLARAAEKFLNEAKSKERDAGLGGRYDDGGASAMRTKLRAYKQGLEGKIPDFLATHYKEAIHESDAEWGKYQELKAKFED